MIVQITYQFDLPEDREDYEELHQAPRVLAVLRSYNAWLRDLDKYSDQTTLDISDARDKMLTLVEGEGLTLDLSH